MDYCIHKTPRPEGGQGVKVPGLRAEDSAWPDDAAARTFFPTKLLLEASGTLERFDFLLEQMLISLTA